MTRIKLGFAGMEAFESFVCGRGRPRAWLSPRRSSFEERVRKWARRQRVGAGSIRVYGLADVVGVVR